MVSPQITIVGQGYVGLPLSLLFAEENSGYVAHALDVDTTKIKSLLEGKSYIKHIGHDQLEEALNRKQLKPSTDFQEIKNSAAVIICVPTPLDSHSQPEMSYIVSTAESIAPHLTKGCIVILESTTYPGTTENLLRPILEKGSGLIAGQDFYLAFSPEREDPGNPNSRVKTIPKLVGGLTLTCSQKATEFYSSVIDSVVEVSSCKVAEAAKLTENIFRSVNIALVNELKVIFSKMDIDVWEVIEAAKTKPFGYMPFYPGPGLGGHCIPIDPYYLSWSAKEIGINTRFIELAGEINRQMPNLVVNSIAEALNDSAKPISGSRILVIGMAYKKNVDDMRESPALEIFDSLLTRGANVDYYDPYIATIPSSRKYPHLTGKQSMQWDPQVLEAFDAAVIITDHDSIDYTELIKNVPKLIDTRNALKAYATLPQQIYKA
jgi:UDP-N-acetyl-D-glucosamine dehydrogenase